MTARSLFGEVESPGQARTHAAGQAGLAGGVAGLGTYLGGSTGSILGLLSGVGAVPALLLFGLADLGKRLASGGLKDKKPHGDLMDPEVRAWYARHQGSVEENRARYGEEWGTLTYWGEGAPVIDIISGELISPPTEAWLISEYNPYRQETGGGPLPIGTSPPEGSAPTKEFDPMSYISTGLGFLGDLVGGVAGIAGDLIPLAQATAPLWAPAAPVAASVFTGQAPPQRTEPVSALPVALPGGAPVYGPTFQRTIGLPGVDLAPEGSFPIVPYETQGRTRMPATVQFQVNGRVHTYKNMGRALLYSGDLAAVKRVKKVASKARRRSGGR